MSRGRALHPQHRTMAGPRPLAGCSPLTLGPDSRPPGSCTPIATSLAKNANLSYICGELGILGLIMNLAILPEGAHARQSKGTMVLPVSIPMDADPVAISSMVAAIEKAFVVLVAASQASVIERADRLAELATGLLEPNAELLEDRVHRMRTVQQVYAEGDWLTAEQLNALQSEPPANTSHPASDWKRRGRIFSVNYGGKEYFARYQFDALYQPLPIIKDILRAFGGVADPWTLAAWFHFPNGWIARRGASGMVALAPKDALDHRDAVLNAAAQRHASYVA